MNAVALCSVDAVKAIVSPETISDSEIGELIDRASTIIAIDTKASVDASNNPILNTACVHLSSAFVLQKMKFSGELASQTVYSSQSRSNRIDDDIKYHQTLATRLIEKYNFSTALTPLLVYGRVGIRTIDSEEYHG